MKKIYHYFFSSDKKYFKQLSRELEGMKTVLDIGCGKNSPIQYTKKDFHATGFDASYPSSDIHDEYIQGNVLNMNFPDNSFDAVIALDFIEHLKKERGIEFLKNVERIAKKKVVIVVPNGFVEQHDENDFLEHRSGWFLKDFKNYKCIGMSGIKNIKRDKGRIIQKPRIFWVLVKDFSQFIVKYFPKHAFHLFCVLNKSPSS